MDITPTNAHGTLEATAALAEANAVIVALMREWEDLGESGDTGTALENMRRIATAPRASVLEHLRCHDEARALSAKAHGLQAESAAQFAADDRHVYSEDDQRRDGEADALYKQAHQQWMRAQEALELL